MRLPLPRVTAPGRAVLLLALLAATQAACGSEASPKKPSAPPAVLSERAAAVREIARAAAAEDRAFLLRSYVPFDVALAILERFKGRMSDDQRAALEEEFALRREDQMERLVAALGHADVERLAYEDEGTSRFQPHELQEIGRHRMGSDHGDVTVGPPGAPRLRLRLFRFQDAWYLVDVQAVR